MASTTSTTACADKTTEQFINNAHARLSDFEARISSMLYRVAPPECAEAGKPEDTPGCYFDHFGQITSRLTRIDVLLRGIEKHI